MHFITRKHLSRRTFLQGLGATMALPLLEGMQAARAAAAAGQGRAKLEKALADYRRIIARNPRFTQIAADYERGN